MLILFALVILFFIQHLIDNFRECQLCRSRLLYVYISPIIPSHIILWSFHLWCYCIDRCTLSHSFRSHLRSFPLFSPLVVDCWIVLGYFFSSFLWSGRSLFRKANCVGPIIGMTEGVSGLGVRRSAVGEGHSCRYQWMSSHCPGTGSPLGDWTFVVCFRWIGFDQV